MRHDGTSATGRRRRLGSSHTRAGNTNSPAGLLGLWSAQGADLASWKNGLGKGSKESGSQPSSLEFRAGLLCRPGNVGLGRGIGLKVSCEDWTNMFRHATECEEKSRNAEAIRVCRVHQRHDRVQISSSRPTPRWLWLMHSLPFC